MQETQDHRPMAQAPENEVSGPASIPEFSANHATADADRPQRQPDESDAAYGHRLRKYYDDVSLGKFPELMAPTAKQPGASKDGGAPGEKAAKGAIYSLAMLATALTWGLPGVLAAYALLKGVDWRLEKQKKYEKDLAIIEAVRTGHVAAVRSWLETGGDPNLCDAAGDSLLVNAVWNQQDRATELLLAQPGISVNATCSLSGVKNKTALHLAAHRNDESMMRLLLTHPDINVNAVDAQGYQPLHYAGEKLVALLVAHPGMEPNWRCGNPPCTRLAWGAAHGKTALLKALLAHPEADVNATCTIPGEGDEIGELSALHLAITNGHPDCVKLLLADPRVDVNLKGGKWNCSPLNFAVFCKNRNEDIVREILKHPKVDPNDRDTEGHTPLRHACSYPTLTMALLEHPAAKVNISTSDGKTLIQRAAEADNADLLKAMLSHPEANVNDTCVIAGEEGGKLSALHLAIREGHLDCVKLLLANPHVDVNLKGGEWNCSPLNFAVCCKKRNGEIVREILKHPKVDPNDRDNDGHTPLHHAAMYCLSAFASALLEHPDTEVNAMSNNGENPLLTSSVKGDVQTMRELLQHTEIDAGIQDRDGDTALHNAALRGHAACVQELLVHMTADQIELLNNTGSRASVYAQEKGFPAVMALIESQSVHLRMAAGRPTAAKKRQPAPKPAKD